MRYGKLAIRLAGVVFAFALAGLAATTATATAASQCPTYATTEPFTPWADLGDYFLAPSGSFETSLTGWTAKGKPVIVSGNEPYHVNSATDSHSLSLPNGTALTSPSICVTLDTPDFRLFVLNTGTATSVLNVNMTYTDDKGKAHILTVARLLGSKSWAPTLPTLFLANITSILNSNGCTWVTFQFAPADNKGRWQIDDFYVDPVKHH
jgi:hypothetical protein